MALKFSRLPAASGPRAAGLRQPGSAAAPFTAFHCRALPGFAAVPLFCVRR